jgi:hypothetical protein
VITIGLGCIETVGADTTEMTGFFVFAGDLTGEDGVDVAGEDGTLFLALFAVGKTAFMVFKASV